MATSRNHENAYRDSVDSKEHDASGEEDQVEDPQRTSAQQRRYDQQVLDEEEEREKLLTGKSMMSDQKGRSSGVRRIRTKSRKHDQRRANKKELIYEVEEGAIESRRSSSSSSENSSERDREKLGVVHASRSKRPSLCVRICRIGILNVLIAGIFVAISYGAYKATREDDKANTKLTSNGTALFAPTTILLSLDGFRADYLRRGITPNLVKFIKQGVSPNYILPSFPSVTFPNHYTMVTGLYPESHGIVGNTFWDPNLKEEFSYTEKSAMEPKWWVGEPLWVTAAEQGIRTATHMWPGSEAHIAHLEPAFVDKFNGSEDLDVKLGRILELLDKPSPNKDDIRHPVKDQRPQIILAYIPNVDSAGHKFGPNSTEIRDSIGAVDTMVGGVLKGLEERNLTQVVNLLVVSDHGMATTSIDRTIQLEDIVDTKYLDHIDGWPHFGLRPKDPDLVDMLYDHLVKESRNREGFDVYLRDRDMPERYHFSNNDRIAPLWVMPHTGWAITTKDELNVAEARKKGEEYHPRGIHGYDQDDSLMRAIFIARGPSFDNEPGSRIEPFQNIEIYNILCDSVGVKPRTNNGTLHLPLHTISLHTDNELNTSKPVYDPPNTTRKPNVATSTPNPADDSQPKRPVVDKVDDTGMGNDDNEAWPDWLREKFGKVKDWIKSIFGSVTGAKNKNKPTSSTWPSQQSSTGQDPLSESSDRFLKF